KTQKTNNIINVNKIKIEKRQKKKKCPFESMALKIIQKKKKYKNQGENTYTYDKQKIGAVCQSGY
ncbi:hypothetical protein, partial [Streptomyces sp. Mg1]|uniref:hypothetical protein n=1 Tax=Streptomyces sp. Mg1 TaxID=465541 RepID=UPI001F30FBB5